MNKFLFFLLLFIILGAAVWGQSGQTYTWTGDIDTQWTNPGNWEDNNGVTATNYPTQGENVIIAQNANPINLIGYAYIEIYSIIINTNTSLVMTGGIIHFTDITVNGAFTLEILAESNGIVNIGDITSSGDVIIGANGYCEVYIDSIGSPVPPVVTQTGSASVNIGVFYNSKDSSGKHWVYGPVQPNEFKGPDYYFINSEINEAAPVPIRDIIPDENYNVYIVNVGVTLLHLEFEARGTGVVEVYGDNIFDYRVHIRSGTYIEFLGTAEFPVPGDGWPSPAAAPFFQLNNGHLIYKIAPSFATQIVLVSSDSSPSNNSLTALGYWLSNNIIGNNNNMTLIGTADIHPIIFRVPQDRGIRDLTIFTAQNTRIGDMDAPIIAVNVNINGNLTVHSSGTFVLSTDSVITAGGNVTINSVGTSTLNPGGRINAGGNVTINNGGTFTQLANANINAGGTFTQTGAGACILNAGITADGGIDFLRAVTVTGTAPILTTTNSYITLQGAVTGAGNLTMAAGAGDISAAGLMGVSTINRLGAVVVNSANSVVFNQTVFAASVNITAGSTTIGTVNTSGIQTYNGAINSNAAINIIGTAITLNGLNTTGLTTITNSGLFTSNVLISSNGGFLQNGAGTNRLAIGITTLNNQITFGTGIELTANTALNSGVGAGNISITGNITNTPASILTFTAGMGNISVTGNIGDDTPLGAITVNSANDITFPGAVTTAAGGAISITNSGNFTVAAPGGNIQPGGVLTVNGNTVNNGTITASDEIPTGAIAIDFQGNYSSSPAGTLVGSSAFNPDIQFGGNVTLGIFTQNNNRLVFGAVIDSNAGQSFSTHAVMELDGNVLVKRGRIVNVTSALLIRQANGTTLTLQAGAGSIDGAVLDTNNASWHIGTGGTPLNDFAGINGTLILEGTTSAADRARLSSRLITNRLNLTGSTFNVSNSGWAYIGVRGNAEIADNTRVVFSASHPYLILEMIGTGSQNLITSQALGSLHIGSDSVTNPQNNLVIQGEVVINYSSPSAGILNAGVHNIILRAGLNETKGSVGRWTVINGPTDGKEPETNKSLHAFRQAEDGTVAFERLNPSDTNVYFEIIGNTSWETFYCREAGVTFQFSLHPSHHVFFYMFDVEGSSARPITLTRLHDLHIFDTGSPHHPPSNDPALLLPVYPPIPRREVFLANEDELKKFWNFNLVGLHLNIENLKIFFSHAWYTHISLGDRNGITAFPFYRQSDNIGYFNYRWIIVRNIIYSFIEDYNGDGKADRIRVQTSLSLNGNFSNFAVSVDDYTVDNTKYNNGFVLVSQITQNPEDNDSFYIYIIPDTNLYNGKSIRWRVTNVGLLRDITGVHSIGSPDDPNEYFWTINTIPPRINYAVTLPGTDQTYIEMSQPVSFFDDHIGIYNANGIPFIGMTILSHERVDTPSFSPILEFHFGEMVDVFQLQNNLPNRVSNGFLVRLPFTAGISAMASLPRIGDEPAWFFEMYQIRDMGVRPLDWRYPYSDIGIYSSFPSPRFPVDWNYSGYKVYSGNSHIHAGSGLPSDTNISEFNSMFIPPNRVLTPNMMVLLEEYGRELENNSGNHAGILVQKVTPNMFEDDGSFKRRITDILVSRALRSRDDPGFFAWPLWARSNASITPNDEVWNLDLINTNFGNVIYDFDGSSFLDSDIDMIDLQVRVNSAHLSGLNYTGISLFYGINAPDEDFRNPPSRALTDLRGSTGGLWLPQVGIIPGISSTGTWFTPIVPKLYAGSVIHSLEGSQNFLFEIKDDFAGNQKFEFLLRFEGIPGADPNLFIARLDAPFGTMPQRWWEFIRPFHFNIEDMRFQRGGVTIFNNVIDPTAGDITLLQYHMLRPGRVTIQVFTLDGTLVRNLRRNFNHSESGEYTVGWDGRNDRGVPVARGMYFIRVVGPDIDEIRRVMVVRR